MSAGGTQRLGDIAWQIKLDRSAVEPEAEPGGETIVLTNESIRQLRGQRMLTGSSSSTPAATQVDSEQLRQRAAQREKLRKHWRKLYDAQRERVRKVEGELAMIEVKISSLADQTGGSGSKQQTARARLVEARQKRRIIADRLQREQDRLQSIIGQARRQGAEPGWFR
jgi:septal ring factor EnvC (AmiA/AmiB activator)